MTEQQAMVKHFDHATIVVRDLERAIAFFELLGFAQDKSVVIKGETFSSYMGVPGIEARHVTLALVGATPRTEMQLLNYLTPIAVDDPKINDLHKIGFNHICFAVENIETAVATMASHGFTTKNRILDFHARKLVFLNGPEGVTVELSQWY
jgi:catechol 2,3-dioxygenase-like lactoylglutathione lyase family enzyme